MNTQAVAFALVAMVALASGLGYDSYRTGSHFGLGSSWGTGRLGGLSGFGGRHLGNSWNGGLSHRRYRRATVGYGSYNPIGHFDGLGSGLRGNGWNRQFGGGLGWRNSFNTFRGY